MNVRVGYCLSILITVHSIETQLRNAEISKWEHVPGALGFSAPSVRTGVVVPGALIFARVHALRFEVGPNLVTLRTKPRNPCNQQ